MSLSLFALLLCFALFAGAQGPLISGMTHSGSIQPDETDQWTIQTAPGDYLIVRGRRLSSSNLFSLRLVLNDAAGATRSHHDGGSVAEVASRSPNGGQWTVHVSHGNAGGAESGDYELQMIQVPGEIALSDDGGPLSVQKIAEGTSAVGDLDAWWVETEPNEFFIIRGAVTETTNTFSLRLWLFGPNGDFIADDDGGRVSEVFAFSPDGGRYVVVVADGYFGGTFADNGRYKLNLVRAPSPDDPPAGDEGGPLGVQRKNGKIKLGDLDAYYFTVASNAPIQLRGERIAGTNGFHLWMRLYDPDGELIKEADAVETLNWLAEKTGRYTVVLGDSYSHGNYAGTGDYTLEITAVRLRALEVTQSVQDWRNQIPLIQRKKTFVRAHLEAIVDEALQDKVSGSLSNAITGTVDYALNETSPVMDAHRERMENPGSQNGTLLFELEDQWTKSEAILHFSLDGRPCAFSEPGGDSTHPGDGAVHVTFSETPRPKLRVIPLLFPGDQDDSALQSNLEAMLDEAKDMFPVVDFRAKIEPPRTTRESSVENVQAILTENGTRGSLASFLGRFADPVYLVMVTPGDRRLQSTNCDFGTSRGPNGFTDLQGNAWTSLDSVVFAHELGHVFGRDHPWDGTSRGEPRPCEPSGPSTNKTAMCGGYTEAEAFEHIHACTTSTCSRSNNGIFPVLGPMNEDRPDEYVFGFRRWGSVPEALHPCHYFELMSYCCDKRWVSMATYKSIRTRMLASHSRAASQKFGQDELPDLFIIRGSYDRFARNVRWLPFLTVSSPARLPETANPAEGLLRIFDSSGVVISEVNVELHAPADTEGVGDMTFQAAVPLPDGIARVELFVGTNFAGSAQASAFAPSVAFVPPSPFVDSNEVHLSWHATDADEQPLSFSILSSRDQGLSWEVLEVDYTNSSISYPIATLPGGSNVQFRVIASDGFRSSETRSASLSIPDKAPLVAITRPGSATQFAGEHRIFFEARLSDLEDEEIPEESVKWCSDRDGTLGFGPRLGIPASSLSEGIHLITLTAQDSVGNQGSATCTITVVRWRNPELTIRRPRPSAPVTLNITATRNTTLSIDVSSNLVDWAPLQSLLNSSAISEFIDRDVADLPQRFYRARSSSAAP